MAPVIAALTRRGEVDVLTLVTGQHREQLRDSLRSFGLTADADLDVMSERQTLPELIGKITPAAAVSLRQLGADYVLVHGDTTTTFAVALAAYLQGVRVAHVEAGLRSFDLAQPFPEEANRRLTDVITDLDLPPTPLAKRNLLREGKREDLMVVTGNTAVDAIQVERERAVLPSDLRGRRLVTVTMHRRENLPVMAGLANALAAAARANPALTFVYPVHLNPAVREAVVPALEGLPNFLVSDPFDYSTMVALLDASELVVTDSGGIQEEGAALGVPVAVLRNVTERPEGVDAGVLRLLGNDPDEVETGLLELLGDPATLAAMRLAPNPYGDGHAGERVAQAVAWRFGLAERPEDWVPGGAAQPSIRSIDRTSARADTA
jgi:UDP-N-acetylglucosamine 2-epimerase (non-hydrolysing)